MESYSDSFVIRGLLEEEPKPVAIRWVEDGEQRCGWLGGGLWAGRRAVHITQHQEMQEMVGLKKFCWEMRNHPLGPTVGAAG